MYGDLYNLEATPAESTTYRFAKHDKKRFPEIITASNGATPYYTNSSHLPVSYTEDVFDALTIQDELQTRYTSGTVFHAFIGERLPDWKAAATLVRKIAENYKLPYYSISPTYSVCKDHGYIAGEEFKCPECGNNTEVYSRITGYYRPVQNWNDGKAQEYKERRLYDIPKSYSRHEDEADFKTPLFDRTETIGAEPLPVLDTEAGNRTILFATKTCPNCKMAMAFLDKAGMSYEHVLADEDRDLVEQFDIHQAPTLVVIRGGKVEKIVNVSNIRKFIEANS